MRRPRPTIRVRLTLLYTAVFALCGAVLVTITYLLLASSLPSEDNPPGPPDSVEPGYADLIRRCSDLRVTSDPDPDLLAKCKDIYKEGVASGRAEQRSATLQSLLWQSGVSLVATTLLAALAGWYMAGRALRPVHQITAAARDASAQNLAARIELGGPHDELRELADTFDDMLERLQRSFDAQQRFIADAGHELRTPLTVMSTSIDVVLAKPEPSNAELAAMARDVREAASDARDLVQALLTLARTERVLVERAPIDLATVAEDALDDADLGVLTVDRDLAAAPAAGDQVLLERLVSNLLDNATRYNVADGAIGVTTRTDVDADRVLLEVANTGPVVAAEDVIHLFKPFHRLQGRTGTDGFGLGLTIVASIAAAHDGTVVARPRDGGGLTVTVGLPRRR